MPSTVVHAAFAVLLVAGALGGYYGWRAFALVVGVLVFAEVDTIAGWYLPGAHRALLHNLVFPVVAAGLLYWDTCHREASWLRSRWGRWGVRVAWVALFAHVFAHVLLDMAHLEGVNPLYPFHDRFVRLEGEGYLSTVDGLVQSFVHVEIRPETGGPWVDVGQRGTTAETHVPSPADPSPPDDPRPPIDRRFPVAVRGWQLFFVLAGAFVPVARRLQAPLAGEAADE